MVTIFVRFCLHRWHLKRNRRGNSRHGHLTVGWFEMVEQSGSVLQFCIKRVTSKCAKASEAEQDWKIIIVWLCCLGIEIVDGLQYGVA
jgi:hypothetical protein